MEIADSRKNKKDAPSKMHDKTTVRSAFIILEHY
jgi:hypothetical protein